jgi:hypothetical protein
MKRILSFDKYRLNENTNSSQIIIDITWIIGENECKKITQYVPNYTEEQMKTLLSTVEGCDAKYIIGYENESILENDIELPEEQLEIYKELVEDLKSSGLTGDCITKIEKGDFFIDDFKIKK